MTMPNPAHTPEPGSDVGLLEAAWWLIVNVRHRERRAWRDAATAWDTRYNRSLQADAIGLADLKDRVAKDDPAHTPEPVKAWAFRVREESFEADHYPWVVGLDEPTEQERNDPWCMVETGDSDESPVRLEVVPLVGYPGLTDPAAQLAELVTALRDLREAVDTYENNEHLEEIKGGPELVRAADAALAPFQERTP